MLKWHVGHNHIQASLSFPGYGLGLSLRKIQLFCLNSCDLIEHVDEKLKHLFLKLRRSRLFSKITQPSSCFSSDVQSDPTESSLTPPLTGAPQIVIQDSLFVSGYQAGEDCDEGDYEDGLSFIIFPALITAYNTAIG
jgi:hypothetical protein